MPRVICGLLDSVQRAEPLEIIRNSALALPDALFLECGHPAMVVSTSMPGARRLDSTMPMNNMEPNRFARMASHERPPGPP
jgi:hypothetical protein